MWEEDAICRISTSPFVDNKLETSSVADVDWNCIRSIVGRVGLGVGATVGSRVGFALTD